MRWPLTLEQRFWSRVRKRRSGCWEWTGKIGKDGYGDFFANSKNGASHRMSWILTNGEIPKGEGYHGICVLHRCDNRKCVNPNHLFLGTAKDNTQDMISKGRRIATLGYHHTKESIAKFSKSSIGRIVSEETKLKMSEAHKGIPKSKEHIQKIVASKKANRAKL